jgi:outer membrane protein assembly factor BamB
MKQAVKTILLWVICTLPLLFFGGCVETPVKEEAPKTSALFYPQLPNPPRIQYLASFAGEDDIGEEAGGFSRFILGDDDASKSGINKPWGVDVYDGKIYATDTRGGGYAIFDLKNQEFKTIVGAMGGSMPKPISINIDTDGTKYITDTVRNQVLIYDANDDFVKALGIEGQFKPSNVAIIDDRLFVADLDHHNIHVLDKSTGEEISTIGKIGAGEGDIYYPIGLASTPDGNLYVSETGNFRVQEFTQNGEFVKSVGSVGTGLGHFARPKGIDVDREGRLYVVDAAFENVQVFNRDGELLMFFGEAGVNHRAGLDLPTEVSINYESVEYFQKYADPKFKLEYVILVANQFGYNKIVAYGFGKMEGMDYPDIE